MSAAGTLSAIGDYVYAGVLKYHNGSAWVKATAQVYSGSWGSTVLRIHTGSYWGRVDTTGV
jgi:hypothetical protein